MRQDGTDVVSGGRESQCVPCRPIRPIDRKACPAGLGRSPANPTPVQRILLVKLNAIGDVLFATPLLEALRRLHPDAEIDWLVGRHAAPILEGHPSLRHRLLYDGPWSGSRTAALRETLTLLPGLRRAGYDAAFCLHRSRLAGLLVRATGARVRVGFAGGPPVYTHTAVFDASRHETERYLDLLRALGPAVDNPGMRIGWTPHAAAAAAALLPADLPRPWCGLAPGGGRNPGTEMLIKRWPAERFAALGQRLPGSVVVCGTPDEAELCAQVAAACGGLNLCGRTRLGELPPLLGALDVFVANDSGPLHIAAAAGTPTVALFGPTDPRLVAPLGPRHRYLWQPPDCGPCYRPDNARSRPVWECDRAGDELRCLRDVSVEDVLAAVTALL